MVRGAGKYHARHDDPRRPQTDRFAEGASGVRLLRRVRWERRRRCGGGGRGTLCRGHGGSRGFDACGRRRGVDRTDAGAVQPVDRDRHFGPPADPDRSTAQNRRPRRRLAPRHRGRGRGRRAFRRLSLHWQTAIHLAAFDEPDTDAVRGWWRSAVSLRIRPPRLKITLIKFGYFDDASREYVITRPDTPLPWINYLGCEAYYGIISNTAGGYSFFPDARPRR